MMLCLEIQNVIRRNAYQVGTYLVPSSTRLHVLEGNHNLAESHARTDDQEDSWFLASQQTHERITPSNAYGLDRLRHHYYFITHRGISWNNGMEELVFENVDDAVNGENEETGLKLFMVAANGGDLDTIYRLVRMDPMGLFD